MRAFVHAIRRKKEGERKRKRERKRKTKPCLNRNYRNRRAARVYTAGQPDVGVR